MVLTKTQVLNVLANVRRKQGRGGGKYYTIGALRILVKKDIITLADIIEEFPELDTPSLMMDVGEIEETKPLAKKEESKR